MKITPDATVLVRAAVELSNPDSETAEQAARARAVLRQATLIAVTLPTLCEFVTILLHDHGHAPEAVARAVRLLCDSAPVLCDRQAVDAGLAMLEQGGDFTLGVARHQGARAGGETFVSFDRAVVERLTAHGQKAREP